VFTVLFAVLNGVSVYLTIPLLDTLFQESATKQVIEKSGNVDKANSILPDWIVGIKDDLVTSFKRG